MLSSWQCRGLPGEGSGGGRSRPSPPPPRLLLASAPWLLPSLPRAACHIPGLTSLQGPEVKQQDKNQSLCLARPHSLACNTFTLCLAPAQPLSSLSRARRQRQEARAKGPFLPGPVGAEARVQGAGARVGTVPSTGWLLQGRSLPSGITRASPHTCFRLSAKAQCPEALALGLAGHQGRAGQPRGAWAVLV